MKHGITHYVPNSNRNELELRWMLACDAKYEHKASIENDTITQRNPKSSYNGSCNSQDKLFYTWKLYFT